MRRYVLVLSLMFIVLPALSAKDLHKEWNAYYRLAQKDRPRDQIEKLHEIRALALKYRLPHDFMRSCEAEQRVYSRLNWKSADSLHTALTKAVESFGEPLLTYRWLDKDWEFAKAHQVELEAGYHLDCQDRKVSFLQDRDYDDILNDFEWILWDRLTRNNSLIPNSEEYRLLDSLIGDRFPARPYLSYLTAQKAGDRLSAMQALAKQYAGTSFRFIPENEVLKERWNRLRNNEKASEAEAKALYDDIKAFTKEEKAENGVNRRMTLSLDYIRESLRRPELSIGFQNDSIVLIGRNFGWGDLTFTSDENLRVVPFLHRNELFYLRDTVKIPIPVLPDGEYSVMAAPNRYGGLCSYQKHTLSMAVRRQGDNFAVYVADYKTGEPIPSATIRLLNKKGKKVLEQEILLNGFTPLPADFQKKLGKKALYSLEARFGKRRSSFIIVLPEKAEDYSPITLHACVFKDRGAYRPGDTLKAKAVLFEGDLSKQVKAMPKGKNVYIRVFNTERKKLADIPLKTNSFGSVSWEWTIPEGERNGRWDIEVVYHDGIIGKSSFRVDEFVLPSFEVKFDPQEKPFLPETDFEISGKVVSYSGHPVDGITLEGVVTHYRNEVWKGTVSIDKDGAFKIPLKLNSLGDYTLNIRALDATGETLDFEHSFCVSDDLSMKVELKNKASGSFSFRGSKLVESVLTESVARFVWTIKSSAEPVRPPVTYRLVDIEGKLLREGTSNDTLDLDMSDCPDGLYVLQGAVLLETVHARVDFPVLKLTTGPVCPVRSVFLTGETEIEHGQKIRARLGAGDGPLWAVATLTAQDGSILESRLVHLDGSGELSNLEFAFKETYPDAVKLDVFYFRDSDQIVHEAVYHRVRHTMELPLSFSRFQDRTRPGASYTLSLQTEPGVEAAVAVYDKSLDSMEPNVWKAVKPLPPTFRKTWIRSVAGLVLGEKTQSLRADEVNSPVWGIVTDEKGQPVIGAVVTVKGTREYAITDIDGRFSMNVPRGTWLEFCCIGYVDNYEYAGPGMKIVLKEDLTDLDEVVVIAYGTRKGLSISSALSGSASGIRIRGIGSMRLKESYEIVPEDVYEDKMPELSDEEYRSVFSEALAFEPCLNPDKDGKVDVTFRTTDKLSTYRVNVFAHDPNMRNATLRRDFVVTVPVKISVTPARYLYEEDRYILSASVSNISQEDLSGRLYLKVEMDDAVEDRQPTYAQAADLKVPAGGSASALFTVTAPPSFQPSFVSWWDDPHFNLSLVFDGDGFSDAVRIAVPVKRAEQTITECHSALAGPEAADSLRRMFVNIPGDRAEMTLHTLREVAESALEQWTAPEDPDALSLSANFYARALLGRDTTGTMEPILSLRCEDGGFAWTAGMESSAVVTATLLERFAVLRDKGIAIPDMTSAVKYLDNSQFGNWWPLWCGGLSDEQYMDIRAMWASVPFDLSGIEQKTIRRSRLKDFRRFARRYLTPGRYDYANGWILDKARRVRTLQNLMASEEGIALGKAWGEMLLTASRFEKSIAKDLTSLQQYAVRHPSGGLYYPNAVLPFRGLLSSEVYAHTLLSSLLDGPVSDGIRLWLALQNETQSWTGDPAYVDALQIILSSSDDLLNRQIVTLTATDTVPFKDIQASGNEMRIDRRFYLEGPDGQRMELMPGDTLYVGDKIVASYELWSKENRSFVRIDAFREACFVPADQLSGPALASIDPIRVDGLWTWTVQCYREVRADRTAWWLDVCPEETTHWEESLFVTQAGTFTAPVITVESLYAPQYRANAPYNPPLGIVYP